jgi:hypothetical protein
MNDNSKKFGSEFVEGDDFMLSGAEELELGSLQDLKRKIAAKEIFIRGIQKALDMGRCIELLEVFEAIEVELTELYEGAASRHTDLSKLFFLLDLRLKEIAMGKREG